MSYITYVIQVKNGKGDWVYKEKAEYQFSWVACNFCRFLNRHQVVARVMKIHYTMGKEVFSLVDHNSRQLEMKCR